MGLLVAALLAGFSTAQAQKPIVFATTQSGSVSILTNLIADQRLDEKNGVKLDIKRFPPAQGQQATVNRSVEVGYLNPIALARVNLRGRKLRMFGPQLWNHISILAHKKTGATTLDAIKGMKLAILPRISGSYNTFALVNRMRGVDTEKAYKLIFGSPPVIMGLFRKQEVEVAAIFEPLTSGLIQAGVGVEVARIRDMWKEATGTPMLMIGTVAYEDWLNANKSTARKINATIAAAIGVFKKNPRKVIDTYRKHLRVKTDAHAALLEKRMPSVYADRWDDKIVKNLELVVSKSVEFGLVKKVPEAKMFVNLN